MPRAVASARVEHPARPTTRSAATSASSHLGREEGCRPVASALLDRQALPAGQRVRIAGVAGDVDDVDPLDEGRQSRRDRGVEPPDGLRAAEDQQHPIAGSRPEPGTRARPRSTSPKSRIGVPVR